MDNRPWTRFYDYNVPTTIRYPRVPVPNLLALPSSSYPDKAATDFFGTKLSFYELRQQVLRFSNALGALGVTKGDRVGIHLPTCPQYVVSYFAVLHLGAIVVNINPLYTPDELQMIFKETGLTTLITFDMVMSNVVTACQSVEIRRVIVTAMTDYIQGMPRATAESLDLPSGWRHFSTLIDECRDNKMPKVKVLPEDPAVIQFTGGTTGVPKGAVLTHANVVAATLQCKAWGSITSELYTPAQRAVLGILPLFHVYGNIVVMNWALVSCATQIMVPRFEIDELMATIERYEQITFFPAVPTLISAILNHPRAEEMRLDRKFGLLNSGAAPMPVELIERVQDMGIPFNEGWGMSETTSLGIALPLLGEKKAGSIGLPFPDTDVKLVDVAEGKAEVKKGEPGEILIRSPLVMQGYWNRPRETAEQLVDGWLHTGDIAVQDSDDYIFIVDRKKDMIIAGGYNIYPREVDEALYAHPKVAEAVAVGISDEYRGETIKAFVVLKPGQTATEKEIIDFCRTKLAAYKAPKSVEFRDELPKSAVGKVLRKILREQEEAKKKKQ